MIPWLVPAWREEFEAWVRGQLARRGISITGDIDQPHIRAWSTVLRAPTSAGIVYAKACSPALAHEPALSAFLSASKSDRLWSGLTCENASPAPVVLAMDPARAWLLMQDSGVALRTINKQTRSLAGWRECLRLYAQLQIALISHTQTLLSLGVMDRRLVVLPELYQSLAHNTTALMVGETDGLTLAEHERVLALAHSFRSDCLSLAAGSIPQTLHHDDLHDGNIFVAGNPPQYTFADWGESCVTHPFFSLVVALRNAAWVFELAPTAPELNELRDVYLREWISFAPLDELRRAATLADRVGRVNRALTWHHVVRSLPEPYFSEERSSVPGWMQEYLAVSA